MIPWQGEAFERYVNSNVLRIVNAGPLLSPVRAFKVTRNLESLGFAQDFLSSCELEAVHFIGIRSFGEEFREDVAFWGIQEEFRKPLA
jgi:hypothetical protein